MLALKFQFAGIESAVDSIKRDAEKHIRDQADLLQSSLVAHTPIDKGGARAGWKTSVKGNKIESVNQVPYIQRLEDNWSKQTRGKGIIGPSLQAFNRGKSK
jgi:hypothetical protein